MVVQQNLTISEKLKILTDAAKYDVACTSSGVGRKGKTGSWEMQLKRESVTVLLGRRALHFPFKDFIYKSMHL